MQIKVKFVSISVLIIILYVCFIFYVFFFTVSTIGMYCFIVRKSFMLWWK